MDCNVSSFDLPYLYSTPIRHHYTSGTEFDLAEFYNRTGHQKEDLIQHCHWKKTACNESSWETVFTHYGKCYMFNKDGDHLLKKAGAGRKNSYASNVNVNIKVSKVIMCVALAKYS